jgi:hypothetical protein
MKKLIIPVIGISLLIGCATRHAKSSHISREEFESEYRLGHSHGSPDFVYLGQLDGRAYLSIRSMWMTDQSKWSEQIVYVELSELDKPFRDALPPKAYKKR